METINDRMQRIVDVFYDGNKRGFAIDIGIAPTSISNYLGKQRASRPSSDILAKIVNSIDVDAMWLLTGKGEMKRSTTVDPSMLNTELIDLCKQLVANYQQRDKVMNELITRLKKL